MRIVGHEKTTRYVYDSKLQHDRLETYRFPIWRHTPCPSCGDPQPLNSWRRKLPYVLVWTGFVAIAAGMLYLMGFLG